jgi:hypothetical protein
MLNMEETKYAYQEWLDDKTKQTLIRFVTELAQSWIQDQKHPKSYPINTEHVFRVLKGELRLADQESQRESPEKPVGLPSPTPPPGRFADLIDERTIKAVFDDQNASDYPDALESARRGDASAFDKIMRAVEQAYLIDIFGLDNASKPRVHFLHRTLFEIAGLLSIEDLTDSGIAGFLNHLCPCGEKHQADAIRKLRQRVARIKPGS